MRRYIRLLAIIGLVGSVIVCMAVGRAGAQPAPAFEAVSIRRNLTDGDRPMRTSLTAARFTYPNTTVIGLIRTAFGIKSFQIAEGWPGWLRTERYDIVAKIIGAKIIGAKADGQDTISLSELRPMLQTLLADRFQLKVRRETRDLPLFALVVSKNGPKFAANSGAEGPSQQISGDAGMLHMKCVKVSMAYFANALESQFEGQFGRKVADRTGLDGDFDITVSWAADQGPDSPGPSIVTALQEQLGLKLESQRGPVETIHIDSIERPSAN